MPRRLRRARALVLAGLALALGLGACGGEPADEQIDALGTPLRLATCSDWERADTASRLDFLEELRSFRSDEVSGQISGRGAGRGYGSVLPDDLALRLFDNRCELPGSDSFLLYKLYSFAAGFAGEAP